MRSIFKWGIRVRRAFVQCGLASSFHALPRVLAALSVVLSFGDLRAESPVDLASAVETAVDRGAGRLLETLDSLVEKPRRDYPVGRVALVVTALLNADVSLAEPRVRRALSYVVAARPDTTYDASCALFALDAFVAKQSLHEFTASETPATEREREDPVPTSGEAVRKIGELTKWLVEARRQRGWTYRQTGKSHDFSNTQFAALGLEVGLQRLEPGRVPKLGEALSLIAETFSRSLYEEPDVVRVVLTPRVGIEAAFGLASRPRQRQVTALPGGWAYRAKPLRRSTTPAQPYAAMTAAGASSLAIVLRAHRRGGARCLPRRLEVRAERALYQSYAWITRHFDEFLNDRRDIYYNLYSLEKAADLGEVERFGDRDWYVEGATRLLQLEQTRGGWGSYINTSLAILFLTRASSSIGVATPIVVTGARSGAAPSDRVYIPALEGYVSAARAFAYLASARNTKLVRLGQEIVENYPVRRREELIPFLLRLWELNPPFKRFVRRSLVKITGERWTEPQRYEAWYASFRSIRALYDAESVEAALVERKLGEMTSTRHKSWLVWVARRHKLRTLGETLVDELSVADDDYRRLVHGTLVRWTGHKLSPPAKETPRLWKQVTSQWRQWYRQQVR